MPSRPAPYPNCRSGWRTSSARIGNRTAERARERRGFSNMLEEPTARAAKLMRQRRSKVRPPNSAAAPNGKRNETLNAMAFRLGRMIARGWIDEKTVADALLGACDANKYLREHGHRATMKTIESGIEAGKKEPHPDLADREAHDENAPPFLTFLTFPPQKAPTKDPQSSRRRAGRRKLAHGRSQIGRCSMTGGASCQIFRLRHCRPRCAAGFFALPVAQV